MAKERLINTRLWSDNWIRSINPLDRYLFLYLLTNEHNSICGIYEMHLSTIAFETGLDERDLEKTMLPRLRPKVFYIEGWVIITNFPKHQHKNSPKIKIGIENELNKVPSHILDMAIGYGYHIDTLSHPNLNPNLNPKIPEQSSESTKNKKDTKTMKKNSFRYNENNPSDTFEDVIDADSGEVVKDKVSNATDKYWEMIEWAKNRRGFPFLNIKKQFKAFKIAKDNEIPPNDLKNRWVEFESDKFWKEKGFDWFDVVNSFNKRR